MESAKVVPVAALDCRAYGGHAGASARIENYLGFPTGISGQALAGRAFVQAQKFGARMLIPAQVTSLESVPGEGAILQLVGGRRLRHAVVVASGARYNRPDVPQLSSFEGRGVWYWASRVEARLCRGEQVVLVGGGNSAGQAAVFLAAYAARVTVLVRVRAGSTKRVGAAAIGEGAAVVAALHRYLEQLGQSNS